MATLLAQQQEFDQLAHRASALGFTLQAGCKGPIPDALFHTTYLVTKDDILVLHTDDSTFVRAYFQLLEMIHEINQLN
jgi:hypothetical protein